MTIVRRFLLAPSFARLIRKERGSQRVTEGYFATQTGRNSHVLVENGTCHLVLVTPEEGGAPTEERTEVPRAHADALLDGLDELMALPTAAIHLSARALTL